ncbi:protein mobC [Burkholderia vietnamiensis]
MRRTIEQAEQLAAKLRALPAVENKTREISKQEEVRLLAADILALIRERNWTIQQVAEYLTTEGLEIGAPTLKSYLQRSKATSKKPSGKRKAVPGWPARGPSAWPQ